MKPVSDAEADAIPRAPTQAAWDTMSPAERAATLERLGPMPEHEAAPSEGDWHIEAVRVSEDALGGHFEKRNRGVYIGRGNTVYYPDERRFAPDLFIVLDVETHKRTVWVVSQEKRGLDFVLEVHYGGRRRKDAEENVARYARLGIPEYFMFDARRVVLHGWRLEHPDDRTYTRIVPQNGRWAVRSLGMELGLKNAVPRWYDGLGIVPLVRELNAELSVSLNEALERAQQAESERDEALELAQQGTEALEEAQRRATAESERAAAESERAAAEAQARAAAEAELARLRLELERLRGG
ncbi:MAG: Uma2 family endonuclease [Bradymonadia bacterium]